MAADTYLLRGGPVAVPLTYKVPQAGELKPLAVRATFDGTNAGQPFYAVVQLIAPNGNILGNYITNPIAAGASADVSWFPGGELETASTASGVTAVTAPQGTLAVSNPTGPTVAIDMPQTGVTAGSYGDASHSAEITVDAEGRVTSAAQVGIAGGTTTIGFEIAYAQVTSNKAITDTLEATGTALITIGPATFDGAPVLLEFFTVDLQSPTNAVGDVTVITLFEGATEITRLAIGRCYQTVSPNIFTVCAHYRFTPTAGSHTYKVCGFVTNTVGTPVISAGNGGVAGAPPAFVRITKV